MNTSSAITPTNPTSGYGRPAGGVLISSWRKVTTDVSASLIPPKTVLRMKLSWRCRSKLSLTPLSQVWNPVSWARPIANVCWPLSRNDPRIHTASTAGMP